MECVGQDWIERNRDRIESENAHVTLSCESDRDPASVWLSIDGQERIGSLTVWDSGSAELQVGAIADGRIVLNESLNWRGLDELIRHCDRLMHSMLAISPPQ